MTGSHCRAPCEAIERIMHGLVQRGGWEEGRLDKDHLLSVKVLTCHDITSHTGSPHCIFTPSMNVVRLPEPLHTNRIKVSVTACWLS